MPGWVAAILDSKLVSLIGRIALTFMFWSSGAAKLIDWNSGLGEMAHFNLNPPAVFAAATIFVQLAGSLLVIWGPYAWLGAGALAVFTALTIPIAHNFWALTGPAAMNEFHFFTEHISVLGALVLVAILRHRELGRAGPARLAD